MAKGAIRAGIDILLQEGGVSPKELNRFYLAGGMGFYVDGQNAIEIGLLPDGVQGKIEVAGNTSLQGAILYGREMILKTPEEQKENQQNLEEIVKRSKEIVLANHKDFEKIYIENMNFWRKI